MDNILDIGYLRKLQIKYNEHLQKLENLKLVPNYYYYTNENDYSKHFENFKQIEEYPYYQEEYRILSRERLNNPSTNHSPKGIWSRKPKINQEDEWKRGYKLIPKYENVFELDKFGPGGSFFSRN